MVWKVKTTICFPNSFTYRFTLLMEMQHPVVIIKQPEGTLSVYSVIKWTRFSTPILKNLSSRWFQ
jgi:hypothetical protein